MGYHRQRAALLDSLLGLVESELDALAPGRGRAMAYGIVSRLLRRWGGTQIYLPTPAVLDREARDRALVLAYQRGNHRTLSQLGAEFGLSGAHVARVLHAHGARRPANPNSWTGAPAQLTLNLSPTDGTGAQP